MGTPAADFSLKGTDDQMHSLADFGSAEVLVVVFMCNHCPYVQAVWSRLVALQERYASKGVQFVGINPNLNPAYPEEDLEHMKDYYEQYSMNFPYLLDESQEVARAYGAVCTPDIFVYDRSRELAYHGRIDDQWQDPDGVTREELAEALDALVEGGAPSDEQNPTIGCSIKWRD